MKIFYPQAHSLHAPAWYIADGAVRPCPETPARVDAILAALRARDERQFVSIAANNNSLPSAITSIHEADYLDYLQTIHARWHSEFQTDVLPDTFPRPESRRPRIKNSAQPGDYCFDLAAPITAGTWSAAVNSARCAIAAAEVLLKTPTGGAVNSAYALCRPPGHHAGPDYCGGFCYLNNAAIAAEHLLLNGLNKVVIFDIDYHHGNGTQDIFYDRADVLVVSIHADPQTQYPYFWGRADETGAGLGAGFNLNFPLPRNCPAALWFQTLHSAVARIAEFRPAALLISLGADIHQDDPVGDFPLTVADFARAGECIRALHLPTAFIQEGGYDPAHLGPCVVEILRCFS